MTGILNCFLFQRGDVLRSKALTNFSLKQLWPICSTFQKLHFTRLHRTNNNDVISPNTLFKCRLLSLLSASVMRKWEVTTISRNSLNSSACQSFRCFAKLIVLVPLVSAVLQHLLYMGLFVCFCSLYSSA